MAISSQSLRVHHFPKSTEPFNTLDGFNVIMVIDISIISILTILLSGQLLEPFSIDVFRCVTRPIKDISSYKPPNNLTNIPSACF
jgi:hypothetical protein